MEEDTAPAGSTMEEDPDWTTPTATEEGTGPPISTMPGSEEDTGRTTLAATEEDTPLPSSTVAATEEDTE